jgi:hypothetical protein
MANLEKIDHVVVLTLENRSGFVTNFADTLPRHGAQDGDPGRWLLRRRRCPGLRASGEGVRRLRSLVQLSARRDLAQPPLRDFRPRPAQPR